MPDKLIQWPRMWFRIYGNRRGVVWFNGTKELLLTREQAADALRGIRRVVICRPMIRHDRSR